MDVTTVAAEVVQNFTGDSSELNTTIMIATTEVPMLPSTTEEVSKTSLKYYKRNLSPESIFSIN